MSDIEVTAERHIRRAASAARTGDRWDWVSAIYAVDVVGTYERHATKAIADACGVNRRTIERRAHAMELYRAIRLDAGVQVARMLRDELTLTHFGRMWELAQKYDISPVACVEYLRQMLYYRDTGESWSADALEQEVEAAENRQETPVTLAYYLPRVKSLLVSLRVIYGHLNTEWQAWINAAPKEAKE